MKRRYLQVLPSVAYIGLFASLYAGIEFLARSYAVPEAGRVLVNAQCLFVAVACGAYGIYRVIAFHPVWRNGYMDWLKTTPWTAAKPLPLGPIHLVWSDILILLTAEVLLLRGSAEHQFKGVTAFTIAYLAVLTLSFLFTGQVRYAWAMLFSPGLLVVTDSATWVLVVALMLYAMAYLGIRRSLKTFPWPMETKLQQVSSEFVPQRHGPTKSGQTFANLGWPFGRLQPCELKPAIRLETGLLVSLLPAWYLFLILRQAGPDEALYRVLGVGPVAVGLVRLAVYTCGCAPPISVLGRVATGRWIIPGYDRVLLAPLASASAGIVLPWMLAHGGVAEYIAFPITVLVVLAIAINAGPTLAVWRLTGEHRLTPYALDRSTFVRP